MVGELRLGHHLPPTGRSLHPAERRRRRPDAARSRCRRRHVHRESRSPGPTSGSSRPAGGSARPWWRACVIPDHFRIDRSGQVLERKPGRKDDRRPRCRRSGGTVEERSRPIWAEQLCLDDDQLEQLGRARRPAANRSTVLARDIEWAFADGTLYLLQCRAVTTGRSADQDCRRARPPAARSKPSSACRCSPGSTPKELEQIGAPVQGTPLRRR